MRQSVRAILLAMFCLGLGSCIPRPADVGPAEKMALLPTGTPLLRCREACLPEWRGAAPQAAVLDRGQRWRDLAWLVLRVGYQDDLTLYYLARAAEGMGYPVAAADYYRQSLALSGTAISCRFLSRDCGGVDLPGAARLQLAALERALRPPPPRHRRRIRRPSERPPPEAVPPETGEPEAPLPSEAGMPPPPPGIPLPLVPAAPAPAPAAAPLPPPAHAAPPGAADFIEPPPAR